MAADESSDGRAPTFVSESRVYVYAILPEIQQGSAKHSYRVSPQRVREIGTMYGTPHRLAVFMDPGTNQDTVAAWKAEGFEIRYLPRLDKHLPYDVASRCRAADIQIAVSADVTFFCPNVVMFVGENDVAPELIGMLRSQLGIHIVTYSPFQGRGLRRMTDEWHFLRVVADDRPLPPTVASASEVKIVFSPAPPKKIVPVLEKEAPAAYALLEAALAVSPENIEETRARLQQQTEEQKIPHLVLAVLFILASFTDPGEREVKKNAIWRRLITYGIDVDRVGRKALALLAEVGMLVPIEEEDETQYHFHFDLHENDPPFRLARTFCLCLVRTRNRIVFADALSPYAHEVLQALEIFSVDAADLYPEEKADIVHWMLLLLGHPNANDRLLAYSKLGVDYAGVTDLTRKAREILTQSSVAPDGDDGERDSRAPESGPTLAKCVASARRSSH